MIIFAWFILSLIVGAIGAERTTGFWGGFFLSIVLSPIIGFIIVIASKRKSDLQRDRLIIEKLKQSLVSVADEIEKLQKLLDEGTITTMEFLKQKEKLLSD